MWTCCWGGVSQRPAHRLHPLGSEISALCYVAQAGVLLVGTDDGTLLQLPMHRCSEWNTSPRRVLASVGEGSQCIACNPAETRLVTTDTAGGLRLWDVCGTDARRGDLRVTLVAEHTLRRRSRLSTRARQAYILNLRNMFDSIDTDSSGYIDEQEFHQMCLRDAGDWNMTDAEIRVAWIKLDHNRCAWAA
jgi:hypothetical protein